MSRSEIVSVSVICRACGAQVHHIASAPCTDCFGELCRTCCKAAADDETSRQLWLDEKGDDGYRDCREM
jgi:hypothetical protein